MFMVMIPQLSSKLFKIKMSQDFYDTATKNTKTLWKRMKAIIENIKK